MKTKIKSEVVEYLSELSKNQEELNRHDDYDCFLHHASYMLATEGFENHLESCPNASKVLSCNTSKVCTYKPGDEMFLIRQQLVACREFYKKRGAINRQRFERLRDSLFELSNFSIEDFYNNYNHCADLSCASKELDFEKCTKEKRQELKDLFIKVSAFRDRALKNLEKAEKWLMQMRTIKSQEDLTWESVEAAEFFVEQLKEHCNLGIILNLRLDRVKRFLKNNEH